MRRLVVLESPFKGRTPKDAIENVRYLKLCMRDSLLHHQEAPYASHAIYTQFLDDDDTAERMIGIESGLCWGALAEATVVYTDRGISPGMQLGIDAAVDAGRPVEFRRLAGYEPLDR